MGLYLKDRDYACDESGAPLRAVGAQALLGEVLFRLSARRGSLPFLPELGSQLYLLRREKPSRRKSLALQYAVQALSGLEELEVTGAEVESEGDSLHITVELVWQGLPLTVECEA